MKTLTAKIYVKKENDVNKILKRHKKDGGKLDLLFLSQWDPYSQKLLQQIPDIGENKLFIIDSFLTPHSFVIFKINKVPALVRLNDQDIEVIDYLPHIYEALEIE